MKLRNAAKRLPRTPNSIAPLSVASPLRSDSVPSGAPEVLPGKHKCGECTQVSGCKIADVVGKCIPLPKPFHPMELQQRLEPLSRGKENTLITDGNGAASYVGFAMSETMFIYPITPSSVMAENADSWVVAGRKNVFGRVPTITEMQSEAGAVAAVHGALVAGGFACSFTSSQGLLLMLPNMFQIAGQLLPSVLHVASRSVSGSTTSICGDHSDVMAVRAAGFAMLSSHTVQEAHDLAVVAHIASLKTSIPFVHFFEGFEISHQVTNISVLPYEEIARLIPQDAIRRHRERALNPHHPKRLNSSTGRDVVFQVTEAVNIYYQECANAVQSTMDEFAALTGRQYHLFEYYGCSDATDVVVIMGSGSRSVEFAVDQLRRRGDKVGVLKVHLFRPWGMEQFMAALPRTARRVAILDRVKECGAVAEPLFLDVAATLQQHRISLDVICGGRYGVSEKGFNAAMAVSVFENLRAQSPKTRFTVGIVDDVTHLSLPLPAQALQVQAPETKQCIFWGMGGDGTVGANKQSIDIICSNTTHNAMAQFFYTPHKSGAVTTSHVRFGAETFESQPITSATYIASHHPSYVRKFDLLKPLLKKGTFVLNTYQSKEEVMQTLPMRMKRQLAEKEAGFFIIDANKVAKEAGLGENINMIMQAVFFKLLGMFSEEQSMAYLKASIEKTFGKKKDRSVVENNIRGVENALAHLVRVDYPADWLHAEVPATEAHPELPAFVTEIQKAMLSQQGGTLPVSAFNPDGATPPASSRYEKRAKAPFIPDWDPKDCNQCNLCAFVCPHSCIRPFLLTPEEAKSGPPGIETLRAKDGGKQMKYTLQVSPMDCTGCEVCVRVCPENSLAMGPALPKIETEAARWQYLEGLAPKGGLVDKWTVRGSQMQKPLLEFSGACDGCAQTSYVKLMTQLFGPRMMIANATGCSSVWGSLFAVNPYTTDGQGRGPAFARSLFEDAAEFGFGMLEATNRRRANLLENVQEVLKTQANVSPALRAALARWVQVYEDASESDKQAQAILPLLEVEQAAEPALRPLYDGQDLFIKPCHWVFGGDGWAHDIGFGGLDHVLAQSHSDINVFVMDNEVYSNTGGQASKSTPIGAVAKMASGGKRIHKKDLGMMAMLYGHVYVAQVSISHPEHLLKVMKEAESYKGPALITAYCPCRDHSVDLGDMVQLCKEAVDSGYFPLYRYDPRQTQPFQLDSDIRQEVMPFLKRQGRYRILLAKNPDMAKKLFNDMQTEILRRNKMQKLLADPTSAAAAEPLAVPTPASAAPTPAPTPAAEPAPTATTQSTATAAMHRAARHEAVGRRVPYNLVAEPPKPGRQLVDFTFNGRAMRGYEGEMLTSALIAAGEEVFGRHHKDGSPQGIFCANGQCSACQVLLNGSAVKGCMTAVHQGMAVESGVPVAMEPAEQPDVLPSAAISEPQDVPCLIIGGGPAGLAAAYELAKLGEKVLIVDDKDRLGGKLVLQTHKFFGTVEDTRAGTRGFDIAKQLGEELRSFQNVEVLLETTAVGVFSDQVVGLRNLNTQRYEMVRPKHLLVAAGARERMMAFPGNTLPGVYGAGAFQTLVNRDWVRPAKKVLIIGGGNVGLIAGYHAIQAGMQVVALVEGSDSCKGYKVHADKLMRLGVPILTNHTIVAAHGSDHVTAATIAKVDSGFHPVEGTEMKYDVDCILVAVGLSEVNEFVKKAQTFGITTYSAGDSQEVAEASAAMLTGRIAGIQIAQALGHAPEEDVAELKAKAEVLRLPGGAVKEQDNELPDRGVRPILHCWQEIPCNACKAACQYSLIKMEDVVALPHFNTKSKIECSACNKCVAACPGLAITVVDTRKDAKQPLVSFPFEVDTQDVAVGRKVVVVDDKGATLGEHPVTAMEHNEEFNTYLVTVQVPREIALKAAAIWQQPATPKPVPATGEKVDNACAFVCRCERVSIDDIKKEAGEAGCADVNQIKAVTRQGMGACGGKNCGPISTRILQQMGLAKDGAVTPPVDRPLFVEIPLKELARAPTPPAPQSTVPALKHMRDRATNAYDVIVLGAGSIGVPLTMALAEAGKKVLCLDTGASPGQGDNKRAIGGIRQTFGQPSKITVMRRSLEVFRTWQERYSEDIGWQQHGYIFPVYREADETMLRNLMDVQHQYGLNIRWVGAEEMKQLIPGINPAGLRGGTVSPEDGNAAPFLASNAMTRRARYLGAQFKFQEDILSITRDVSGAVSGVLTYPAAAKDRRPTSYYAPLVVNALGATSNAVLQTVGRELPLDPDSHEAGVTEAVQRMFSGLVVDLRPQPGSKNFYFYQNNHGQLVFCITPDPPITGYDTNETSQFLPQVSKRLVDLLPRLANVSVRRTWRGLYSNTADGQPLCGWDRAIPGLLHATGMGGHGFMLGPGVGELMARLVTDKLTDEDKMVLEAWDPMREFKGDELLR